MISNKDHEKTRQQVWLEAWCRTVQSDTCLEPETATRYADHCLKDFDERWVAVHDKQ